MESRIPNIITELRETARSCTHAADILEAVDRAGQIAGRTSRPHTTKRTLTPAGRQAIAAAQKKRWAAAGRIKRGGKAA